MSGRYYVSYNGASVFVKEANFFEQQRRESPDWDTSAWHGPIEATSIENARAQGRTLVDLGQLTREGYKPAQATPAWLDYDAASDCLLIHGKRYSHALFDRRGFLSEPGTLLRVELDDGRDVVVVTKIYTHLAEAAPAAGQGETWAPMNHAAAWLTNGADLHPATINLVVQFARALAAKLSDAEKKYGYSDGWRSADWMDECRQHLAEHVIKGDPRDVAAYCAFLWHHGEPTHLAASAPALQAGETVPPLNSAEAMGKKIAAGEVPRTVQGAMGAVLAYVGYLEHLERRGCICDAAPQAAPVVLKKVGAGDDCTPVGSGCCGCTVTTRCFGCPYAAAPDARVAPTAPCDIGARDDGSTERGS